MKKLLVTIVVFALLLVSVCSVTAAEAGSEESNDIHLIELFSQWASENYQAKHYSIEESGSFSGGIGYYDPEVLCRHTNGEGAMDWALMKVESFPELNWEIAMRIGELIVSSDSEEPIFTFGYGVYDAKQDQFYDLYDIHERAEDYPQLMDTLREQKIGRPIGDADTDGYLTVLDATRVQRILAELDPPEYNGAVYYLHEPGQPILDSSYYADYDLDSDVTIVDATGIQRALANLD